MINIHALLIAAGESKRMGSPKQLLSWGKYTLIEHQINVLQRAGLPVSVVLGANFEMISNQIESLNVQVFENKDYARGMGTSISCGIEGIRKSKDTIDGVLIALVDQPLIDVEHFKQMLRVFKSGEGQVIVSKTKTGLQSAPVLFDSCYLDELIHLKGDKGAKQIIKKYSDKVLSVVNSDLEDMDTQVAYQNLLNKVNHQS